MNSLNMEVIKRNGNKEPVYFDKITARIKNLCFNDDLKIVNPTLIAQKTITNIYDGITTTELDNLSARICASLSTNHYLYDKIAARICVSNLHKETISSFHDSMIKLYTNKDKNGRNNPLICKDFITFMEKYKDKIEQAINYDKDFNYNYFGYKTLEKAYLIKINDKIIERPQHMLMRVAIGIHYDDIESVLETYELMSNGYFTHASPTIFNAGTPVPQLSSCFLMGTEDSIEGIYKTMKDCALISKRAGGLGVHISNVRSHGSIIKGTNGHSNGIVPMLQVYNYTARYVNQGGRRPGSIAIYLEPWHADVFNFLDLRKNTGSETDRARDLFLALWIPDIFMERVKSDKYWSLMCPDECPGLSDCYGSKFNELYISYETIGLKWIKIEKKEFDSNSTIDKFLIKFDILQDDQGIYTGKLKYLYNIFKNNIDNEIIYLDNEILLELKNDINDITSSTFIEIDNKYFRASGLFKTQIPARDLWKKILEAQIETGNPYIGFKDHVNNKTNHQNLGVIKSSNLCIEINEYSDNKETAVCNLASIAVNKYITKPDTSLFLDKDIKIYSKSNCDNCLLAKMLLKRYNVNFTTIVLDNQTERFAFYEKISEEEDLINTMPQIFIDNKRFGGYQELKNYLTPTYDYNKLKEVSGIICRNLNKIIDINFYPTPETNLSNKKHRPIGIGIQGLADTYLEMMYPFDSDKAMDMNKKIMETIYYGALEASNELAIKDGKYSTFDGSPFSKGILQFDMWGVTPSSNLWDWNSLKENIVKYGTRNSLLTALMPTASTSQILGNNECFEPISSNIYTRRTQAGEFRIINKRLICDLMNLEIWNDQLKDQIIYNDGSIQKIQNIPNELKQLYKTVWEIPQKYIVQQAADRGPFIDQSQSMNIFMEIPEVNRLQSSHFAAWSKGLKTGIYYLRSKPSMNATKFAVNMDNIKNINGEDCVSCSG